MHIESHLDTLVTEEVPFAQFMANKTNLSLMCCRTDSTISSQLWHSRKDGCPSVSHYPGMRETHKGPPQSSIMAPSHADC